MPEQEEGASEGAKDGDLPEMPEPLELTDKEQLEGVTLRVQGWREAASKFKDPKTEQPLGPYLIYEATRLDTGEPVTFAGGQVMDDQARKMNEPFKACVKKAKGKRYWQFRKPEA